MACSPPCRQPAGVCAGDIQPAAHRPRRGALRPGDEADAGNRRLHRYPLPGGTSLQEARGDLLAAGGRRSADRRRRDLADLPLPPGLGGRCERRRARARLARGVHVRSGGRSRRGADAARHLRSRLRGAHRQDRRHAAGGHAGRPGCAGAALSRGKARRGDVARLVVDLLDRAWRRRAGQGPDHAAGDRLDHRRHRARRQGPRLARPPAAGRRNRAGAYGRRAVVCRHHDEDGLGILVGFGRQGPARQGRVGSGIARRAAGLLRDRLRTVFLAVRTRRSMAGSRRSIAGANRPCCSALPGTCLSGSCSN